MPQFGKKPAEHGSKNGDRTTTPLAAIWKKGLRSIEKLH